MIRTGNKKNVVGVMSGTSLDGLDLALCEFGTQPKGFAYVVKKTATIEYPGDLKNQLRDIKNASARDYFELNAVYGKYIGEQIKIFLSEGHLKADAIASHGHTVFHQPHLGFSTQIGCGPTISATTGLNTVCDFRSLDVANGGQGAPLVPIGDKLLFSEYQACLNIGGIANISFDDQHQKRIAYDICEANMLLNHLSEKVGKAFDKGGEMARSGRADSALLHQLNEQDYYSQKGAKSLGREWFEKFILKCITEYHLAINDLLATSTEHIAQMIANNLNEHKIESVLVTGGGAFNSFLLERISAKTQCKIILPDSVIINFKEAIIFGFLGYLRLIQTPNTLGSVTGARIDSVGGAKYLAPKTKV